MRARWAPAGFEGGTADQEDAPDEPGAEGGVVRRLVRRREAPDQMPLSGPVRPVPVAELRWPRAARRSRMVRPDRLLSASWRRARQRPTGAPDVVRVRGVRRPSRRMRPDE